MAEAALKTFEVHLLHGRARARPIEERSFEAAALAYVEDFLPHGEDEVISVVVEDVESGAARCFRVDLDDGEASPCA